MSLLGCAALRSAGPRCAAAPCWDACGAADACLSLWVAGSVAWHRLLLSLASLPLTLHLASPANHPSTASVQYPPHAISRILSICIYTGDVELVQRVLRSGLGADATGVNSQASVAIGGEGLGG